jgi:hypothetical protein
VIVEEKGENERILFIRIDMMSFEEEKVKCKLIS